MPLPIPRFSGLILVQIVLLTGCLDKPFGEPPREVQAPVGPKSSEAAQPKAASLGPKRVEDVQTQADRAQRDLKGSRSPTPAPSVATPPTQIPELQEVFVLEKDPAGCTWVESKAAVSFGYSDTTHQARAQAVAAARDKAVENFLGMKLQGQFMNFQAESTLKGQVQLTESLLRVAQYGRILKERVLSAGLRSVGDCENCRFVAHIQTCIVPLPETSDKGFNVHLRLSRSQWEEGDEGFIEVVSTRDAYVYIYNVGVDWEAAVLFPNDTLPSNHVTENTAFTYPPEEFRRKRELLVKAELPPNLKVSAETIRVIASKVPLPREIYDPMAMPVARKADHAEAEVQGAGSFLDLLRKLNGTEIEWVEDHQGFTIHKK